MRTRASRTSASTSALVERACKLLPGGLFLAASLGMATTAWSADATDNRCWGYVASHLAQAETGAMGEHSSSHGLFTPDPGDGGRRGVGNVSKEDHSPDPDVEGTGQALAAGAQGKHADDVGNLLGADFISQIPGGADSVEARIDPIDCPFVP